MKVQVFNGLQSLEKLPGLFFLFPVSGLPALMPSSTLCFADVDDPTRNKRPRKRNPDRTRKSNEPDATAAVSATFSTV